MLFQQLFDNSFLNFFAFNSESNYNNIVGLEQMPSPRPGRPNFGDVLMRHCTPRHRKHAKNITIYLQWINHLNGKVAAVLGKEVLMFDEKKI